MITRFYSFEEASIYAGVMQSEGHYAVVLDNAVGFFYGPLFINGFRVLVSDEPVEEDEPLPMEVHETWMLDAIRIVVSAFAVFGLLWATLGLASGVLMLLRGFSQGTQDFSEILPLLTIFFSIIAVLTLCTICAPWMEILNRILRDESSVIGWIARGTAVAWVAMQLMWTVYILLMIACWLIHGSPDGGIFRG